MNKFETNKLVTELREESNDGCRPIFGYLENCGEYTKIHLDLSLKNYIELDSSQISSVRAVDDTANGKSRFSVKIGAELKFVREEVVGNDFGCGDVTHTAMAIPIDTGPNSPISCFLHAVDVQQREYDLCMAYKGDHEFCEKGSVQKGLTAYRICRSGEARGGGGVFL